MPTPHELPASSATRSLGEPVTPISGHRIGPSDGVCKRLEEGFDNIASQRDA